MLSAFGLMALSTPASAQTPDQDSESNGLTLDYIVDRSVVGHAADGFYLDFEPFFSVELPRIMLIRDAEGNLGIDAFASTKNLLDSGSYGLMDDETLVTDPEALAEKKASKSHLYSPVALAEEGGHIVADFSITRHFMFGLAAMALVLLIFATLANRYKRGIGRKEAPRGVLQNMMEVIIVFIRDEVAKPNIGAKYKKFVPYLLSAFFFILTANILGLVPFSGSATGNLAVTGVLALFTFVIGQVYATADHWKHIFLGPSDAPVLIRVILVPIEILGLITRHAALAIRLFANMMGGSLVIFSLIGIIFIINVLFASSAASFGAGIISTGFIVFILLLKLLVAFIQAYVFTILSALFIGMAVEEHGHHDEEHTSSHHDSDASASAQSSAAAPAAG